MQLTGDAGRPDPARIARAAGREAGVAPDFLGSYVLAQLDVISTGRRLRAAELAEHGLSGARAAEDGIALRGLVDLYLSATWRAWRGSSRSARSRARPRAPPPWWPCARGDSPRGRLPRRRRDPSTTWPP